MPLRIESACLAAVVAGAEAVTPSAILSLHGRGKKLFAAPATFGDELPVKASRLRLPLVTPEGLQDGCSPELKASSVAAARGGGFVLFVQRSPNCTFEARAIAAQAIGASALVVQNTIEGIYHNRYTAAEHCHFSSTQTPSLAHAHYLNAPPLPIYNTRTSYTYSPPGP